MTEYQESGYQVKEQKTENRGQKSDDREQTLTFDRLLVALIKKLL